MSNPGFKSCSKIYTLPTIPCCLPSMPSMKFILLSQDYENKRNLKHIRFTLIFPVRYKKYWQIQQLLVKGLYDLDMEMETLEALLPHPWISFLIFPLSYAESLELKSWQAESPLAQEVSRGNIYECWVLPLTSTILTSKTRKNQWKSQGLVS